MRGRDYPWKWPGCELWARNNRTEWMSGSIFFLQHNIFPLRIILWELRGCLGALKQLDALSLPRTWKGCALVAGTKPPPNSMMFSLNNNKTSCLSQKKISQKNLSKKLSLRRKQERPRLLGCLHTVCTPCLNQVLLMFLNVFDRVCTPMSSSVQFLLIYNLLFFRLILLTNSKLLATKIFVDDKNVNTLNCLPFTWEQKSAFLGWPPS